MEEQRRPEGSGSDPGEDRPGSGGQTGLEEPIHQLGLGEGDAGGDGAGEPSYPERPAEPNCIYYMRTGLCGYGERCRFNHPRDRALAYGGGGGDGYYPERDGQPLCQYYMRTGSCKFGSSCKYHHPRPGAGSAAAVGLNIYGYPLRPGEKECPYYMKTGQCKFGVTCKFNHPQAGNVQVPNAISTVQSSATPNQPYGIVAGGWHMARPPASPVVPGSYVQGPYGPMLYSPGVAPVPGWTPYMPPVGAMPAPSVQSTVVGSAPLYGNPPVTIMAPPYAGPYPTITSSPGPSSSIQKEQSYPERPGQPDCQHYLRTGECKYGMWCRYHHPVDWAAWRANFALSPMGLPLRPDAPICTYFVQHGVCKYGPTCKFNHPISSLSYSPSATSLSDLPVAPYPFGPSIPAFAPSSSSPNMPQTEAVPEAQQPSQSSTKPASPSSKSDQAEH